MCSGREQAHGTFVATQQQWLASAYRRLTSEERKADEAAEDKACPREFFCLLCLFLLAALADCDLASQRWTTAKSLII